MYYARRIANAITSLNRNIGRVMAWASIAMVLVQFGVVVLRYVFGIGALQLQESIIYLHGAMFLLAAADTLIADAHVRVDIFYANCAPARRALINLCGAALFLIPSAVLIFYVSIDYVTLSWAVREGSRETSGIQAVFLLKSLILVFSAQLAAQGIAQIINSFDAILAPSQSSRKTS